MKTGITTLVCGLLLAASGTVHADHKLLATDLLDAKKIELQAGYEFSYLQPAIVGNNGYSKTDHALLTSAGVGLGYGLQLDFALRQGISRRNLLASGVTSDDGAGDMSAAVSYKILGGEKKVPAVVAGLGLGFENAWHGNPGSATTNVTPFVAASYELGDGYVPYWMYRANFRSGGKSDSHELTVGIEKLLNRFITLDGKGAATFRTGSAESSSAEDYSFELGSYLQVAKNFYLLPSLAALQQSRRTIGTFKQQSVAGIKTGLSIYYYFE